MADGPEERVKELRQALDDSARNFRAVDVWFLGIEFAAFATVATTTHDNLFFGTTVPLPIINVGMSAVAFFTVVPVLLLLLHFNLLMQAKFLSTRAVDFNAALDQLGDHAKTQHQRKLLFPSPLAAILAGSRDGTVRQSLLWLMSFATAVAIPLMLLMYVQVVFLPYQADWITWLHRALVLADIVLVWYFWLDIAALRAPAGSIIKAVASPARLVARIVRRTREVGEKPPSPPRLAFFADAWRLGVGLTTSLAIIFWSVFLSETAGGPVERLTGWHDLSNASAGALMRRNFEMQNRSIFAKEPERERVIAYMAALDTKGKSVDEIAALEADIQARLATPIRLDGRSFRYADLRGAKMTGASLVGVELASAKLDGAQLQGTNLRGAHLPGADLIGVQLQGAILTYVELQGADLTRADLHGANLKYAKLKVADLTEAQLQVTDLRHSELQGADLTSAELQGANLSDANLSAVDMRGSAVLYANFNSADLSYADLRSIREFEVAKWEDIETTLKRLPAGPRRDAAVERMLDARVVGRQTTVNGTNLDNSIVDSIDSEDKNSQQMKHVFVQDATFHSDLNSEVSDYYSARRDVLQDLACQDWSGKMVAKVGWRLVSVADDEMIDVSPGYPPPGVGLDPSCPGIRNLRPDLDGADEELVDFLLTPRPD